jgi:hypothetical protein
MPELAVFGPTDVPSPGEFRGGAGDFSAQSGTDTLSSPERVVRALQWGSRDTLSGRNSGSISGGYAEA